MPGRGRASLGARVKEDWRDRALAGGIARRDVELVSVVTRGVDSGVRLWGHRIDPGDHQSGHAIHGTRLVYPVADFDVRQSECRREAVFMGQDIGQRVTERPLKMATVHVGKQRGLGFGKTSAFQFSFLFAALDPPVPGKPKSDSGGIKTERGGAELVEMLFLIKLEYERLT